MTEPTPAVEATTVPEREIQFRDRTIWVHLPRPEQMLVWKRTLQQLQGADMAAWDGDQVMNALERGRKIIDSIILHNADKTWLDDLMLDGDLGFEETASIINLTVEAFAADDNRADRRAATKKTPAKKATRRKATPR